MPESPLPLVAARVAAPATGRPQMQSLAVRLPLAIGACVAISIGAFLLVAFEQVQRALVRAGEARAQVAADQLATLLAQSAQQRLAEVRRAATDADVVAYLLRRDETALAKARQRLGTLTAANQPPVELWDNQGHRLLVVAHEGKTATPTPPIDAQPTALTPGIAPFVAQGNTVYWTVVAAPSAQAPAGFVVSRRALNSASGSEAIAKLVGSGATLRVGNLSGSLWTDLNRPVEAPAARVEAGAVTGARGADGEPAIGSAAVVRGTPWMVFVAFPRRLIVDPAQTFLLRMLLAAAVLSLLAVLAAHALSGRLIGPLVQLTDAAESIAGGRFDVRVDVRRRDEVGRLATAFSTMAQQVETAHLELEARVDERTKDIRALNGQLTERVEQLRTLSAELEAFSYSVSHDLRAPLRHVVGFASLLEKRAGATLDADSTRYLRTIVDAAARMGRLVDDLLGFSRMARADMHRTSISLDDLVADVIREVQQEAGGRDIQWTVHPLPVVQGDRALLRVAFFNLVSNAVKYTSTRAVAQIEIGVTGEPDGGQAIYLRDNGVGFDMKYVDKLFGVFQRLHGVDEFEGTGIGLANVRRIVQRHGGTVRAEGAVDGGATFFVSLPS